MLCRAFAGIFQSIMVHVKSGRALILKVVSHHEEALPFAINTHLAVIRWKPIFQTLPERFGSIRFTELSQSKHWRIMRAC